jgi:hypothetical protein
MRAAADESGDPELQQAASAKVPDGEEDEHRLDTDENPESPGLVRTGYVSEVGSIDCGQQGQGTQDAGQYPA